MSGPEHARREEKKGERGSGLYDFRGILQLPIEFRARGMTAGAREGCAHSTMAWDASLPSLLCEPDMPKALS